jgi:predicted nucleic acid-binding protein
LYYVDTSALVKLVVTETETPALQRFIANLDPADFVTSAISRAELLRAASRRGDATLHKAREILGAIAEITLTQSLLERAGTLEPPALRTLDAIHLATALELGSSLAAFVAYDARLLAAAEHAGIAVVAPT